MLTRLMFSLFDSKANAFAPPFMAQNPGMAIRMVASAAADGSSDLYKFGGDYTLFEIATFYEETGLIEPREAFHNHGTVLSILNATAPRTENIPNE